jgi:8-oxo-dGTP diphosphatase
MSHTYEFARPALTVDAVVFALDEAELKVLLIRRGIDPFKGKWALPGGFVRINESLSDAVVRELEEETHLHCNYLEQLGSWGDPDRDPREHVVTVAWYALVRLSGKSISGDSDADDAAWHSLDELPELAFDHAQIVQAAHQRLRQRLSQKPIGLELLPEKFPLRDLQNLYEQVLGHPLDKRNFRRKVLATGVLEELDEWEKDVQHRAAQMYRFDTEAYQQKVQDGWVFEVT